MKITELKDENYYLSLGKELYNKRNFQEALKEFDRALKKKENFTPALYYKGVTLSDLKQYSKALEFINKALELDSSEPGWLASKAIVLMNLGRYEDSLNFGYQALQMHPNKYWWHIASIHAYFKKFEDALECIEKALNQTPEYALLQRVKAAIIDGLKYGENYYIPIARSLLLKLVPFEDTIIYTTCIKIKLLNGNFLTDAIITNNALICMVPYVLDSRNFYISWDRIVFISKKSFKFSGFRCKLHRDPHYESKEEFKNRSKSFRDTIFQLREDMKKK